MDANERASERKSERDKAYARALEASHARYNEVICVFLGVNPEGMEPHCVLVGLSRQSKRGGGERKNAETGPLALLEERRLISPAASRITNNRLASFH